MSKQDLRIFGDNCIYEANMKDINNNVIVCGGSGSGKTMSIVEPLLLNTYNSSLIVIVNKRRIIDTYTPLLKQRGYIVKELNFVDPELGSCSFEPMDYIKDENDLTWLSETFATLGEDPINVRRDPFWQDSTTGLINAFLGLEYLRNPNPKLVNAFEKLTKLYFLRCVREEFETNYDSDFFKLRSDYPSSNIFASWQCFRENPTNTARCVYATTQSKLNKFNGEFKRLCDKEALDIGSMGKEKTVLFIVTSPVNNTLNSYIDVVSSIIFKELFEKAEEYDDLKLPVPVHFVCDDFATSSRIKSFPEYISIIREKNISVLLLLQSESQINNMYGKQDAITIINNCDTYVYMGSMDYDTASTISLKADKPIADILWMKVGEEIIFRRGEKPCFTKRYNILEDKEYIKVMENYNGILNNR